MKLRNIISIVTAGLFMMSSCTDEELIDSSTPDSGLSISLTTKGVMTKAAADGYTHSTPDEIKMADLAEKLGREKILPGIGRLNGGIVAPC